MSKAKLKSFANQFVAFVSGDVDKVVAEKVYRQRIAGLKTSFHNAEGNLVDKEQAVADAEEWVVKCRLNQGVVIPNRELYVKALIKAKESVLDRKEELEAHKLLIASLKEEIDM